MLIRTGSEEFWFRSIPNWPNRLVWILNQHVLHCSNPDANNLKKAHWKKEKELKVKVGHSFDFRMFGDGIDPIRPHMEKIEIGMFFFFQHTEQCF